MPALACQSKQGRPLGRQLGRQLGGTRGFSITELLVVIGIIVLLVGILLPALSNVVRKSRETETLARMEEFSKAVDLFHAEFGFYPGVVPEHILASDPQISGTENAILHMMGGFVRQEDVGASPSTGFNSPKYTGPDWVQLEFGDAPNVYRIKINKTLIGQGPVVNGKPYPSFYSPKSDELEAVKGQKLPDGSDDDLELPDLKDAWGQPIIYVRLMSTFGPLVGPPGEAQFSLGSAMPYLTAVELGELARSQDDNSILAVGSPVDLNARFGQIIRNEAFGARDQPMTGQSRGAYVLISAGADGIFFSRYDGLGKPGEENFGLVNAGPEAVRDYDDLRHFGGG